MRRLLLKALLVAGCAGLSGASASAADKLSVRLDFSPWGVQAAMHLAQYKGWFKEAGLDVDIQDGRGSGNTIQLVNAGQADVGQVQVGLVGSARAKGATIKSIATFQRKTDLCVLVDKDSSVGKVADLCGKSMGAIRR
jgi:NitT/TauT family transport system substrate-binding protein